MPSQHAPRQEYRVLVKDSSSYKETAAWTVMNVTNAKMKLGMGIKKS